MGTEDQDDHPGEETDQAGATSLAAQPGHGSVHDSYAALRYADFRRLSIGNFITSLGRQMLNVAVGWELYERTGSALALAYIGLAQVLPVMLLALVGGQIADRFDRTRIVLLTQLLLVATSVGMALLSYWRGPVSFVYVFLTLIGFASAFNGPARATLVAETVPPEAFANAATWRSSTFQLAAVVGPALGGLLIAFLRSATLVYALDAVASLIFVWLLLRMRRRPVTRIREPITLKSALAGIGFLRRERVLLSAITLDLFAVLLGGATVVLPIFAKDVLHVGPAGLGWLRAAPSVGAVVVAFGLAYAPPFKQVGKTLLWSVGGFGVATIVFGLSQSFVLSLVMLALLGGLDSVSVVIRNALFLVRTPDEMRGRVNALTSVFVSMSNELGGFESGVAAALFGPVASVVGGGIGTIVVVLLIAWRWPEVRRLRELSEA